MKVFKFIAAFLLILCLAQPTFAQEGDDYAARIELANKMHELRPVRDQVENAVDRFIGQQSTNVNREAAKEALLEALNYQSLERISAEAYASTFTQKELVAMVEYYSKPEARSASDKIGDYAAIVYPEIVRMLDAAMLKKKLQKQ